MIVILTLMKRYSVAPHPSKPATGPSSISKKLQKVLVKSFEVVNVCQLDLLLLKT